jgi:hypothetical protein
MDAHAAERTWKQATHAFLLLVGMLVLAAVTTGLGWWTWDQLINNPMPYSDPEASETIDPRDDRSFGRLTA